METTLKQIKSQNLKLRNISIIAASILGCIAIFSLIMHLSPKEFAVALGDFAVQHYFLFGLITLTLAAIIVRYYFIIQ